MDAELLREIPGYKAILKAVLKSQIQMLVEQLSSQGEEESILLTASLSDGTLHHLGSLSGKNFLDGREEIKSQFLFHCLNGKSRNSHSDQEQIFVPQGMIPPEESYHQMARPAKKPRRTLPFPSGRGRKAQSQIRAGTGNLKRPRSAATVTRPAVSEESVVPVATETETRTVPGHDLVTVKAEDFEWNIDLNAESGERVEAPVDNDQSDMDKTNHPKQGNISVPTSTRRSFSSDKSDLNRNSSVGEVKVSDGCDVVEMLKDSVVPVKVELADEFERAGLESGASQGLYGGPGPSGDMDNSTWAPGVSEGMESFGSEAESLNASVDHGNQSSSRHSCCKTMQKSVTRKKRGSSSLTPEEKKARFRERKAKQTFAWRERRKAQIGIEAFREKDRLRRRKNYIKAADLPEDQLQERRKKLREQMRRYRQKAKQKKAQFEFEVKQELE